MKDCFCDYVDLSEVWVNTWFRVIVRKYILAIMLFLGVGQAFAFDIVNSEKHAIIVIPDNAVSCVSEAANELQYHVRQSSGVSLDIVKESDKSDLDAGFIYLGECKATAEVGIVVSKLDRGSFVIKTVCGNLYMAGQDGNLNWLRLTGQNNSAGTLFAVYELLDRFMGVRWLWPGKLGEVIPHRDIITLDEMDLEITLPLTQARLRVQGYMNAQDGWSSKEVHARFLHDQNVWLRRHRFGWDQSLDMGHAFVKYWERFAESHPEIFNMLPDGRRYSDPTYHGGANSLISMCVSQPAPWKIIVDDWKANRTEVRRHIDISENDTPDGFEPVIGLKKTRVDKMLRQHGLNPSQRKNVFLNISYYLDCVLDLAKDIAEPRVTLSSADVKKGVRQFKRIRRRKEVSPPTPAPAVIVPEVAVADVELPPKKKRKRTAKKKLPVVKTDELVAE